jgi:hypothetical protein
LPDGLSDGLWLSGCRLCFCWCWFLHVEAVDLDSLSGGLWDGFNGGYRLLDGGGFLNNRFRGCGNNRSSRDVVGMSLVFALAVLSLDCLLLQETENVVQNKVTVGLLGQEKCLSEFAPGLVVVGHFTDDLNDDPTICRGLGVDGVDENLAVVEADRENPVVDFLMGDVGSVSAPL